eukprot:jgi/Ulvmu1/1659/UM114_0029.1
MLLSVQTPMAINCLCGDPTVRVSDCLVAVRWHTSVLFNVRSTHSACGGLADPLSCRCMRARLQGAKAYTSEFFPPVLVPLLQCTLRLGSMRCLSVTKLAAFLHRHSSSGAA